MNDNICYVQNNGVIFCAAIGNTAGKPDST